MFHYLKNSKSRKLPENSQKSICTLDKLQIDWVRCWVPKTLVLLHVENFFTIVIITGTLGKIYNNGYNQRCCKKSPRNSMGKLIKICPTKTVFCDSKYENCPQLVDVSMWNPLGVKTCIFPQKVISRKTTLISHAFPLSSHGLFTDARMIYIHISLLGWRQYSTNN